MAGARNPDPGLVPDASDHPQRPWASPSVAQSVAFQRRISACVAAFGVASTAHAQPSNRRHVDDDAAPGGDGRTWQTAYTHIQQALQEARQLQQGFDILVAQGRYYPDPARVDPAKSFELNSGGNTSLFGGFRGLTGGGDPGERDLDVFRTYLDGDIGEPGLHHDDSLVLVSVPGGGRHVVQGFYLENANSAAVVAAPSSRVELGLLRVTGCRGGAGAIVLDGALEFSLLSSSLMDMATRGLWMRGAGSCSAVVHGCRFEGLRAPNSPWSDRMGGAIRSTDVWSLWMLESTFFGNHAPAHGGAVALGGFHNRSTACRFEGNTAGADGGAVWADGALTMLSGCSFSLNRGLGSGGGAFLRGSQRVHVQDASFTANHAELDGGGLWLEAQSRVELLRTIAHGNQAGRDGGGIHLDAGRLLASACTLDLNAAGGSGGGGLIRAALDLEILGATLTRNTAGADGGALAIHTPRPAALLQVDAHDNAAQGAGGAIWFQCDWALDLREIDARRNTAGGDGGALCINAGQLLLSAVTLSFNSSGGSGGGLLARVHNDAIAFDATLTDNTAALDGGGMSIEATARTRVTRARATGNLAGRDGGAMHLTSVATIAVNRSLIAGNVAGAGGAPLARGGGAWLASDATSLVGCTIAGNAIDSLTGAGAGVFADLAAYSLLNNIILANRGLGGATGLGDQVAPLGQASFAASILPEAWAGPLNIAVDPRLDAGYRPLADSPAINAALTYPQDAVDSLWDLDGRTLAGRLYDIGCYERQDLTPECNPADFGGHAIRGVPGYAIPDQALSTDDMFVYLTLYQAGDRAADLTSHNAPGLPGYGVPDGAINDTDFFYVFQWYAAGC